MSGYFSTPIKKSLSTNDLATVANNNNVVNNNTTKDDLSIENNKKGKNKITQEPSKDSNTPPSIPSSPRLQPNIIKGFLNQPVEKVINNNKLTPDSPTLLNAKTKNSFQQQVSNIQKVTKFQNKTQGKKQDTSDSKIKNKVTKSPRSPQPKKNTTLKQHDGKLQNQKVSPGLRRKAKSALNEKVSSRGSNKSVPSKSTPNSADQSNRGSINSMETPPPTIRVVNGPGSPVSPVQPHQSFLRNSSVRIGSKGGQDPFSPENLRRFSMLNKQARGLR